MPVITAQQAKEISSKQVYNNIDYIFEEIMNAAKRHYKYICFYNHHPFIDIVIKEETKDILTNLGYTYQKVEANCNGEPEFYVIVSWQQ